MDEQNNMVNETEGTVNAPGFGSANEVEQAVEPTPTVEEQPKETIERTDEEAKELLNKVAQNVFKKDISESDKEIVFAKVVLSKDPFREATQEEEERAKEINLQIFLPSDTPDVILDRLAKYPNVNLVNDSHGRQVLNTMTQGAELVAAEDILHHAVTDTDREWHQEIQTEKGALRLSKPIFKKSNTKFTGEDAVIRVNSRMGLGGLISVPLWHSGFWVTLKTPSDAELIELEYNITQSKINLGRAMNGLLGTNESVYIYRNIFQLFEDHIYSTSLKDSSKLAEKIKLPDMQTIAWALASAIWPKGFFYTRSIIGDDHNDNRIIRGMVDVSKLYWVDRSALSDYQIQHMSKRQDGSISDEELKRYQEDFKSPMERKVVLDKNEDTELSILLSIPSLADEFDIGEAWVQKSITETNNALTIDASEEDRNKYLTRVSLSRILGRHSHYIKHITFDDGTGEPEIYDERETIDAFIETWSTEPSIRTKYFEGVNAFIDNSTIGIVATPTVEDSEDDQLERFPHLVPMDATITFFILLVQKLNSMGR